VKGYVSKERKNTPKTHIVLYYFWALKNINTRSQKVLGSD